MFVDLPITAQPVHDIAHPRERRLFLKTLLERKPAPLCGPIEHVEPVRASNVAEDPAWTERAELASWVAWPLAACLRSADTPQNLVSYATLAKAGELGDLDDWKAAEKHWRKKDDVRAVLDAMLSPRVC